MNALRSSPHRLLILGIIIAALGTTAFVVMTTLRVNAGIDDAVRQSALAQQIRPTHACQAFTLPDARQLLGDKVVMNNAFKSAAGMDYSGIRAAGKDVTDTTCTYNMQSHKPGETLIVGIRDPHSQAAARQLHQHFMVQLAEETPITLEGVTGFKSDVGGPTNLRLWTDNKWFDASAPTLRMAEQAILVLIKNS